MKPTWKEFWAEVEDFIHFITPFFGLITWPVNPRNAEPIFTEDGEGGTHVADFLCFEWLGQGVTFWRWSDVRTRT